jgi:sulfoacetaldehyde dehydrogenase
MSPPAAARVEAFERDPNAIIDGLVRRAREAMDAFKDSTQARVDEAVTALAWSLYKPERTIIPAKAGIHRPQCGRRRTHSQQA